MPFLPAESAEPPRVTVFIPTWNGGPLFDEVLREICAQETPVPFEVLAIDSGSKDGTLDVLAKHRVRVLRIPNSEFNHGLTRNRAVQEARGEIVVLTVQDATPASRHWLATMVSDFSDPEVVGVYCHQIPRPDCSPFLKDRLKSWVSGEGQPTVRQVAGPDAFWALPPVERFHAAAFDNVSSAVRRSFALEHPFQRRQFGEDVTWARGAILAGKKIVMEPRVAVIHSHQNSIWYEFRRAYLDHQNLNDLFGPPARADPAQRRLIHRGRDSAPVARRERRPVARARGQARVAGQGDPVRVHAEPRAVPRPALQRARPARPLARLGPRSRGAGCDDAARHPRTSARAAARPSRRSISWRRRKTHGFDASYHPSGDDGDPAALERRLAALAPDVIHAHCFYNSWPPDTLARLSARWPVAFTLHDVYAGEPVRHRVLGVRSQRVVLAVPGASDPQAALLGLPRPKPAASASARGGRSTRTSSTRPSGCGGASVEPRSRASAAR